jgi:hypothetical protein
VPLPFTRLFLRRMDFTELYKHTASLVSFSAGGHLILTAIQDRLIVRQSDTFQIARTWLLDDTISHIGWSRDSEYVFGACAKKGFVCVYKLEDENWNARIVSGAEGLSKAEWAPDGRSILCFSEWGVRLLFSLTGRALTSLLDQGLDMVSTHQPCHLHPISKTS